MKSLAFSAIYCTLDALDTIVNQLNYCPAKRPELTHSWGSMGRQPMSYFLNDRNVFVSLKTKHNSHELGMINEVLNHNDYNLAYIKPNRPRQHSLLAIRLKQYLNRVRRGSFSIRTVSAIRLLRLDAPQDIQIGQPMKLRCLYETKGDKLQSLSWYKNGREFYRYQPFERHQPMLAFNLTGVNVDIAKSRNNIVVLTNTTSETSGRYKCEATGTTFQEVNMETYVNVVAANSGVNSIVYNDGFLSYLLASLNLILLLNKTSY